MTDCCRVETEPCHSGDCDGYEELMALLPKGQLWRPDNGSERAKLFQAVGALKTGLNKRICQEFSELDPCNSLHELSWWADFYRFPSSCVTLTGEKLCEWIELLNDDTCKPGSQGFILRAIEFVAPSKDIQVQFNVSDFRAHCWCASNIWCPDHNPIVITAPPECYAYESIAADYPHNPLDGVNGCRRYYIPEIECLRKCVFPFGLGVGYKTYPEGPEGEFIYGVPETGEVPAIEVYKICNLCYN